MRQFEATPARRKRVPFFLGIAGPAGTGKTYSALRVARGMQRVFPGPVCGIDTEAGRLLHYAHTSKCGKGCKDPSHFDFEHIPFAAPFAATDYLEAIQYAQKRNPACVIIDSASHMHNGPGGLLAQHAAQLDKFCGDRPRADEQEWQWDKRREKANLRAWIKPKADMDLFVTRLLQLPMNIIFCFRAKDKVKPGGADNKLIDMGLSAIGDDSLIFEMIAQALLEPGARGVPKWIGKERNEMLQTKLPEAFTPLLSKKGPLDEDTGEMFARWAMGDIDAPIPKPAEPDGDSAPEPSAGHEPSTVASIVAEIKAAPTTGDVAAVAARNRTRTDLTEADRATIKEAIQARTRELQK